MKNEWVKVSDDMPPLDQVVITWDGYTLGMDYSDYCVDAGDVYFANLKEVTHWALIDTEDELTEQLKGECGEPQEAAPDQVIEHCGDFEDREIADRYSCFDDEGESNE